MKIRSLFFIAIVTLLITSCNSTNKKSENENESVETTNSELVVENGSNANVVHLTNETFKQKVFNYEANQEWNYEGEIPCIVDFYADWCGPCKRVAPILDELAKEYDGKIIIYKVDTDKQQAVAQAFGIRSIPSILFVPAKGEPQMAQGALPKETFIKAINEVLLKKSENG